MSAELSWEDAVRRMQDDPARAALVLGSYFDRDVVAAASRFEASEEWGATKQLIPSMPGMAVDLGAGRGLASYALARAGWTVVAVEPDPGDTVGRGAVSSLCSRVGGDITVCEGTAEHIPLGDTSADLVYARAVLHHAADMRLACREVARVLKPGGCFLAVREHVIDRMDDEPAFLAGHELHALYGGEHAWPMTVYRDAIEGAGLKLIHLLGSYDSPVNFAPYSIRDVWGMCARPLIKVLGWRVAGFVAGPDTGAGRWLLKTVGRRLSARDDRPGRLFSFVAAKPQNMQG